MSYLFADAVAKCRKHGYATLTEGEKWDWHADVYGFRRVVLGIGADEHTSPCDTSGEWFDERRAQLATDYYRAKYEDAKERRRKASAASAP